MDEAAFWAIIDRARGAELGKASPEKPSANEDRLLALLQKEPDEVVKGFSAEYARQMARLNRWSIWGAGYVITGGISDDGFHYFRSWLIGKGKAAVEQALADPDGLGPFVDDEEVDNEGLEYAAHGILEERGLEDDSVIEDSPEGEMFDEETVAAAYPRLARQFG